MVASPTIRAFFSLGVLASSIILTGVLVYVVLYFFKRSDRFIQTYSSMLGTELIINLIAFVLVLIGANLIPDDPIIQGLANVEDLDTVQFRLTPLVIAVLGLQVWLLTIRARILARACEISMLKSFLIVIGVMIAVAMLISIFQGTP